MWTIVICSGRLLPEIVELNEFGRWLVWQKVLVDAKEVLSKMTETFDETLSFLLGPFLVDAFGDGTL